MANNPALIKEVAAIAPLSFFLPSAPHALSARTAPVQAMIPVAPMKRHATSASALILPASLRYSSVQKVCRVCSRGNVRQDAKLPADEERGKVVSLRIADGNAQETTESHERRRMDGERRVERDASSIVEAGGEMADSDREPKGEHRTIGTSTFVPRWLSEDRDTMVIVGDDFWRANRTRLAEFFHQSRHCRTPFHTCQGHRGVPWR